MKKNLISLKSNKYIDIPEYVLQRLTSRTSMLHTSIMWYVKVVHLHDTTPISIDRFIDY